MMRRALMPIVVACAVACVVAPVDLSGRACDDSHPCLEGWVCTNGICDEYDGGFGGADGGLPDAGPADGGNADGSVGNG